MAMVLTMKNSFVESFAIQQSSSIGVDSIVDGDDDEADDGCLLLKRTYSICPHLLGLDAYLRQCGQLGYFGPNVHGTEDRNMLSWVRTCVYVNPAALHRICHVDIWTV